jgi:hypothetical protein
MESLWDQLPGELIEQIDSFLTYTGKPSPDYLFEIEALRVPAFTYDTWPLFARLYVDVPRFRDYIRSRIPAELIGDRMELHREKSVVFSYLIKDIRLHKLVIDMCRVQKKLRRCRYRIDDSETTNQPKLYTRLRFGH